MSTTDRSSVISSIPSDAKEGVDSLPSTEHFCGMNACIGEFGLRGSGGGVVDGGEGTKTSTAVSIVDQLRRPSAPGALHGGTDKALFMPKPPESIRSQSALLSGVNVTLAREGDEAISSGVPL